MDGTAGAGAGDEFGVSSGSVSVQGGDDGSGVRSSAAGVTAQTDAEGGFLLEKVPLGEQVVTASLDGYVPQDQTVEVDSDGVEVDFVLERVATQPVIGELVVDPQVLLPNETANARVELTSEHPEGELTDGWEATGGFEVAPGEDPSAAVVTALSEFDQEGMVRVVVENDASDSASAEAQVSTPPFGRRAVGSVVVQTEANQAPVITDLSATPQMLDRGASSTVRVWTYDPDGDTLTYSWSLDNADWTLTGSGDQVTVERLERQRQRIDGRRHRPGRLGWDRNSHGRRHGQLRGHGHRAARPDHPRYRAQRVRVPRSDRRGFERDDHLRYGDDDRL